MDEYRGDPFDIIYNQMVMHHIKDINTIFRKFYHLLSPGGILAIADLYPEDNSFHDGALDVQHGFDPDYLKEILHQQGFHGCQIAPCFVIRKELFAGRIKEYPVFLLTAYKNLE